MSELKDFLLGDYRDVMSYIGKIGRSGLYRFSPLIITCAITGGTRGKEVNPNVPESPQEQADQARDAYNAGASMVHIHARDPVKAYTTATSPDAFKRVNALVREKCPDIIVNNTCLGGRRFDDVTGTITGQSLNSIDAKPEVASLDISAFSTIMNFPERKAPLPGPRPAVRDQWNYMLTLDDSVRAARLMKENGIKPEFEMYSINDTKYIYHLEKEGVIDKPYWIQILFGGNGLYPAAEYMIAAANVLPQESMFSVIGVGACQTAMITLAIILGHHVRVGMEDNMIYAPKELANSNAQFVERVARIARELGRPIATPTKARAMLGLGAPRQYHKEENA
jgi:3-keto-5-aminohexanoate cleavage enzyme